MIEEWRRAYDEAHHFHRRNLQSRTPRRAASAGEGLSILNVDLKPHDMPGVNTLIGDLTDSGQTFNALSMHFGLDDYNNGALPKSPDAVVHFAAIPCVMIEPDNKTFVANVTST